MQALKCYERYSMGQTYNYKHEIQISIIESLPVEICSRCSIKKIIRIAINLLKINPFQCSLLCWMLKKTNCLDMLNNIQYIIMGYQKMDKKYLTDKKSKNLFQETIKISILQQLYDKKVLIILLLNGYNVKNHLLNPGQQIDIDPYLFANIPKFDQIYRNWKPQKSLKSISLSQINKIFLNWTSTQNIKKKVDYNRIIDKILFLSKTYNVGTTDQQKQLKKVIKIQNQGKNGKKKTKKNQNQQSLQQNVQQKGYRQESQKFYRQQSPMRESISNKIPWFDQQKGLRQNYDINPLKRSTQMNQMNQSFCKLSYDDMELNQSLFKSFRSCQSNQPYLLNSLRNSSNKGNFLKNSSNQDNFLRNNQINLNNSIGLGFGNFMFNSTFQNNLSIQKSKGNNQIKKNERQRSSTIKLKPTKSFEQ